MIRVYTVDKERRVLRTVLTDGEIYSASTYAAQEKRRTGLQHVLEITSISRTGTANNTVLTVEMLDARSAELRLAFPTLDDAQTRLLHLCEIKGSRIPDDIQLAIKPEYPLVLRGAPKLPVLLKPQLSVPNHNEKIATASAFGKIPTALRVLRRWAVWIRYSDGRKRPFLARDGKLHHDYSGNYRAAKSNDPDTWCTFDEAVRCASQYDFVGGISFALGDGYVGFDFDGVRNPDTKVFDPRARDWMLRIGGYSEVSQSQRGAKSITRGRLSAEFLGTAETGRQFKGIPDEGMAVEVYNERRFFYLTGLRIKGFDTIKENQEGIDTVCKILTDLKAQRDDRKKFNNINLKDQSTSNASDLPRSPARSSLPDVVVLEKIRASRQAHKFNALWVGDLTDYASPSEADFALINILKFWCDDAQTERLFSQSELGKRDKWTERDDYRARTIRNAQPSQKYNVKRLPLRFKEAAARANAILKENEDE